MNIQLIAGIILAVIGIVALARIFSFSKYSLDADSIPEVIKESSLWKKEFEFRSNRLGLVAKPDVVFRHNGRAIVGEAKTRKTFRIYPSDVIQLSVGRAVIQESGSAVSDVGFVKVVTSEGARWLDKQLLTTQEVLDLKKRYDSIQAGEIEPGKCSNKIICRSCEFVNVC